MTDQQVSLLKDIISLTVFLVPVLTLFWKVARYTAKIDNGLSQKEAEINQLKDIIKELEAKNIDGYNKIEKDICAVKEKSSKADDNIIEHSGVLSEHGTRIDKLEARTDKMCEDLTDIKTENAKQTSMLELLVKNRTN